MRKYSLNNSIEFNCRLLHLVYLVASVSTEVLIDNVEQVTESRVFLESRIVDASRVEQPL